eukprot:SAG31_NODE_2585_length_5431_cov_4.498687_2_plen_103_part_00
MLYYGQFCTVLNLDLNVVLSLPFLIDLATAPRHQCTGTKTLKELQLYKVLSSTVVFKYIIQFLPATKFINLAPAIIVLSCKYSCGACSRYFSIVTHAKLLKL